MLDGLQQQIESFDFILPQKIPLDNLKILSEFIMRVYAPTWFQIKRKPYFYDGPQHLWHMIDRSKYLSDDLKKVIYPVIQRAAYYAHPENILVTILLDERKVIRELAVKRILIARNESKRNPTEIRKFVAPKI
jgi:hypothetical protein